MASFIIVESATTDRSRIVADASTNQSCTDDYAGVRVITRRRDWS